MPHEDSSSSYHPRTRDRVSLPSRFRQRLLIAAAALGAFLLFYGSSAARKSAIFDNSKQDTTQVNVPIGKKITPSGAAPKTDSSNIDTNNVANPITTNSSLTNKELTPTEWLRQNLRVAILTTNVKPDFQKAKVTRQVDTWLKDILDAVNIVSDGDDPTDSKGRTLPGFISAKDCGHDHEKGLWCKNAHYLREWQEKYLDRKWFFRLMDDTYILTDNLYEIIKDLDPDEPYVIGEKWCYHTYEYPTGGSGMLFSRGVIRNFNWDLWNRVPTQVVNTYLDDLCWGGYLQQARINITHHNGFSQNMDGVASEIYQWMSTVKPWRLPFKPIAWHLHGHSGRFEDVHRAMISRDFTPAATLIKVPVCYCPPNVHSRCVTRDEYSIKDALGCRWGAHYLRCLFDEQP